MNFSNKSYVVILIRKDRQFVPHDVMTHKSLESMFEQPEPGEPTWSMAIKSLIDRTTDLKVGECFSEVFDSPDQPFCGLTITRVM